MEKKAKEFFMVYFTCWPSLWLVDSNNRHETSPLPVFVLIIRWLIVEVCSFGSRRSLPSMRGNSSFS